MKKKKSPVSEISDEIPKEILNIFFFSINIPFFEMPVILGDKQLWDFKDKIVNDVIPFMPLKIKLDKEMVTSMTGKKSNLLKSIFIF